MNETDRMAVECAKKELVARAFSYKGENTWEGRIDIGLAKPIKIRVELTDRFPYELPNLYVDYKRLPRIVPHVDRKGKICIAEAEILIDSERPDQIIIEALSIAESTLRDGLAGKSDSDIAEEFLSYLEINSKSNSICNPTPGYPKEISLLEFKGFHHRQPGNLFADDLESGKNWLNKMDFEFLSERKAWFYVLSQPIMPPDYKTKYRNKHFIKDIKNNSSPQEYSRFIEWLKAVGLPAPILVSIPISETSGTALYAIYLNKPSEKEAKKGGFRGKLPFDVEIGLIMVLHAEQSLIVRLDRQYLINRGGAFPDLQDQCVTILGCGSVGSFLAEKIASLGVGNIRLIDNDILSNDNVHRHYLGVECLSMEKAHAMKIFLENRFPHLNIEYMQDDIIDIMQDDMEFITGADLLCIALGHETLELNINRILKHKMPRLHTWVEPLGIGGHVFATGLPDGGGCFKCLFDRDETYGLRNMSAFSAPGQRFSKTYSGCSGFYTPYSVLHADRTAIEAANLAVDILKGRRMHNFLLSWYGDPCELTKAGFRQSDRTRLVKPGQIIVNDIRQIPDCICRQQ